MVGGRSCRQSEQHCIVCTEQDIPVVVVECLELREVAVKGGNVPCPYTPERANFENLA